MNLLKKLHDRVRTLIGIRRVRQLPAPKGKPALGTSIVLENLRMRLVHPIDEDFWRWLSSKGWRAMLVNMRKDRRRYHLISEKVLVQMILANEAVREQIHSHLTQAGSESGPSPRH